MADFVGFNEFVDLLGSAKAENHFNSVVQHVRDSVTASGATVARTPVKMNDKFEQEFGLMKKYLLNRYEKVSQCGRTYLDRNGNFVDCIPFEDLPTVRAAKKAGIKVVSPPASDPTKQFAPVRTARAGTKSGLLDQFGHPVTCPDGMIPLHRITLSQMSRCGTFERFFYKTPTPSPGSTHLRSAGVGTPITPEFGQPVDGPHFYARCAVTGPSGPYTGSSTGLNVWNPNASPGVMTLSQLWMVGDNLQTAKGPQFQTVESGWFVYPTLLPGNGLGDDPVLWVFFNPDGYGPRSGYMENAAGEGFIQLSNDWTFMSPNQLKISTPGGPQIAVQMLWQIQDQDKDGNGRGWYLYLGTTFDDVEKVGYIPIEYYANTMLAQSAQTLAFGGEVGPDYQFGAPRAGEMGSGELPDGSLTDNFGQVAFQNEMYARTSLSDTNFESVSLSPDFVSIPQYNVSLLTDSDNNLVMFFGGPATS
jgi:hypothetical protein